MKERKTVKYTHWKCFIYHIVHRMEMNRTMFAKENQLKFKIQIHLDSIRRRCIGQKLDGNSISDEETFCPKKTFLLKDFFAFAKRRILFEVKTFSFHQKRFERFFLLYFGCTYILFRFVWSKWSLWIFRIKHNIYAKDFVA